MWLRKFSGPVESLEHLGASSATLLESYLFRALATSSCGTGVHLCRIFPPMVQVSDSHVHIKFER